MGSILTAEGPVASGQPARRRPRSGQANGASSAVVPARTAVATRAAFEVHASADSAIGHFIAAELRELYPRSTITVGDRLPVFHRTGDVTVTCAETGRRLVVFGQSPTPQLVDGCLAHGIWSMVTVDSPNEDFSFAARSLVSGPAFVTMQIIRILATAAAGAASNGERLTAREQEVLALLADGLSNAEIARELVVSVNTVRSHVQSLFQKFEVGTRAKLVARARSIGMLS